MKGQQPYESFKKIFDSIKEGINKRIQKGNSKRLEKENNKMINYHIKKLEDLLNEMYKNVKKDVNLSEIEVYHAVIDLDSYKHGNESMQYGYNIKIYLYNKDKDKVIEFYLDPLSYKIKCTDYSIRSDKIISKSSFELPDSRKNISFMEDIKNSILGIYSILNPEVLKDMGKQYMHIGTVVSVNSEEPIKENPEIRKYGNLFSYDNGRFVITMTRHFDDPSKL